MIPDDEIERCMEIAEQLTERHIEESEIRFDSEDEIRIFLNSQYDVRLLRCLQEKNYGQYLQPDNKADPLTTKIELRKAEYFKTLKKRFL